MRYFFGAHSHKILERIGGVDSVLLSLFLHCGQALREFGGVNETETSRRGSVLGKWLGDHEGAARSRVIFMEIEMTSFSRDITFRDCGS